MINKLRIKILSFKIKVLLKLIERLKLKCVIINADSFKKDFDIYQALKGSIYDGIVLPDNYKECYDELDSFQKKAVDYYIFLDKPETSYDISKLNSYAYQQRRYFHNVIIARDIEIVQEYHAGNELQHIEKVKVVINRLCRLIAIYSIKIARLY